MLKNFLCSLLVLLFLFSVSCFGEVIVSKIDWDKDGKENEILLENQYWKIVFYPEKAGKAVEVTGKIFNNRNVSANEGWFIDCIAELSFEGKEIFECNFPYQWEILKQTPEEGTVKIYTNLPYYGSEPSYKDVSIIKTYTLKDNSPKIYAGIEVKNNSQKKLPFSLCIRNYSGLRDLVCFPEDIGIMKVQDSINRYHIGLLSENPVRPWMGFIGKNPVGGIIILPEWKYLDGMEVRRGNLFSWGYRTQTIEPGKIWETHYYVYPFKNMNSVEEANNQYIMGILLGNKNESFEEKLLERKINDISLLPVKIEKINPGDKIPIRLQVSSLNAEEEVDIVFGIKKSPEDKIEVIDRKKVVIKGLLEANEFNYEYEAKKEGLFSLVFQVIKNNKILIEGEKPLKVGDINEIYSLKPIKEPQTGEKKIMHIVKDSGSPDYFEKVDLSFETPHIKWGKPYYKGKTKVLFVSLNNNDTGHLREIYERIDIVPYVNVLISGFSGGFPYSIFTLKNLYKNIKEGNYDVIFFGGIDWDKGIPEELKQSIFSKILNGKGAVIIVPNNKPVESLTNFLKEQGIKADIEFLKTGQPYAIPEIEGYEVGKGRIILFKNGLVSSYQSIEYSLGNWQAEKNKYIPGFEYGYGLFGKCIYWAGKKESDLKIKTLEYKEGKIKLAVENIEKEIKGLIEVKIKDKIYKTEEEIKKELILKTGLNEIDIALNRSIYSDGLHLGDIIIEDNKGNKIMWASIKFKTEESPVSLSMSTDKISYREGEVPLSIINLSKKVAEVLDVEIEVNVYDAWNRNVFRQVKNLKLESNEQKVEIPLNFKAFDILHDIEVEVKGKNFRDNAKSTIYIVPKRMAVYDDFYLGCWGHLADSILKIQATGKSLKEAGIEYIYSYLGEREIDTAYRNHLYLMGPSFLSNYLRCTARGEGAGIFKVDRKTLSYNPSLYPDEERLNKIKEELQKIAKDCMTKAGIDYFFLDDERWIAEDFDWSEGTIEGFRNWLKKQYLTLGNLNRQWNTNFNDWEEVMPVKREGIEDMSNLSRWLDWRRFIGWVVSEYYTNYPIRVMKEVNPNAVCGMHGIYPPNQPGRHCPHDFWLMSKEMKITARYNSMEEEWFNSFGVSSGPYSGYGIKHVVPSRRYHPWSSLFHGGHWAFFYQLWTGGSLFYQVVAPDQTPYEPYKILKKEEFDDIKGGIGKIFIESQFTDDGIVLPYSQASLLASDVLKLDHRSSLYSFKTIVQDLGYQHISLSYEEIEKGRLNSGNFRVLLGPSYSCLSDQEVKEIKDFIRNGGVLITDYQFGKRDVHGKQRNKVFDEVFGIDSTNAKISVKEEMIKFIESAPEILRGKSISTDVLEEGILVKKATVWAESESGIPVVIVNKYGKGYGIYLNISLNKYASYKGTGIAGEVIVEERSVMREYADTIRDLMREILKLADIERPRIKFIDKDNQQLIGETFYYSDGVNNYIGFIPSVIENKEVLIDLKDKEGKHLYDIREGKYLGEAKDKIKDIIKPGKVKVYGISGYTVEGIDLDINPTIRQGEIAELKGQIRIKSSNTPGLHILRIKLYNPEGKEEEAYTNKIKAEAGKFKYEIPFALNDKTGNWKIEVEDVLSKKKGIKEFVLVK